MKSVSEKWNQMQYEKSRFLYYQNGNPFENEKTGD